MSLIERTPDGHLEIWQLYRPEPWTSDGVWMRRCDVFSSEAGAKGFLNALIGVSDGMSLPWQVHPLFSELQVAVDGRGYVWYLCPAPLDPPGRQIGGLP